MTRKSKAATQAPRQIKRQGDVLLVPIDAYPFQKNGYSSLINQSYSGSRSNRLSADGGVILAFGEETGHKHEAKGDDLELDSGWSSNRARERSEVLNAPTGAQLVHEEHATVDLEPGLWEVRHQREYTPRADRWVRD